jgi:hypothetical protein
MRAKYLFLSLMALGACKDKYMPHINTPAISYLVVEGFINAGTGPTTITLTRASGLDSIAVIPETSAQVEVQSANGAGYPLSEQPGGNYTADQVPVDPAQQYRLHIKTSNGKEYVSDLSEVRMSPPIDSVTWKAGSEEAGIFVSTHDPLNNSVYYRWQYIETWQYNTPLQSPYIRIKPLDIQSRTASQLFPLYCWASDLSTNILVGTSAALSQDNIYEFPIATIPYVGSNKLLIRYSILVKQYVLTKDGYDWQQKIKKNTEQLGSIFDPQPSGSGGNIHSTTDPAEIVVGFVGCSSETEKRIFINRADIPAVLSYDGYDGCMEREYDYPGFMYNTDSLLARQALFITGITKDPVLGTINGVLLATPQCVDCRLAGGTGTQPDFWQ